MSVVETQSEIKDSKAAIEKVEEEIKDSKAKIEKVEEEIENEKDTEEKKALRKKEEALRDDKKALRKKEEQLNDRLNILLQQQQQQPNVSELRPPSTPRLRRDEGLVPPSIGKAPKEEADPKGSPSSDEGISEGLSRIAAAPSMRASSNSVSIEFVGDLHKITTSGEVEARFNNAANYVYNNWHHPRFTAGKNGVYKNERWLTGIVCNALNLVLQANGGLVALHQGCIGSGATHSDLSVSAVGREQSPPLLVCEGKQDSDITIRQAVRGQLFNELVRHRRIFAGGSEQRDFRPALLMALNTAYVSLELAFPTTKGGHLKTNEWITPEANAVGDVVFFTVQIAFINIDSTGDRKKLANLFCFIEGAVKKLRDMKDYKRDQWKTPWVKTTSVTKASKHGDNVTVVDEKRVYKEFCYYLRQQDGFNTIPIAIEKQDQRKPPPEELLRKLGKPYSDWVCEKYAGGWFEVLEYDFIQGDQRQVTKASWMSLLKRIEILHDNGYVHGDILPRNMLFSGNEGYIIDFDLMRQENQLYVLGYNHMDFSKYRHPEALAQKKMEKKHDVHALAMIGREYFGDAIAVHPNMEHILSIDGLLRFFDSVDGSHQVKPADLADPLGASGSPFRD